MKVRGVKEKERLRDPEGRIMTHLRISLTQRCNLHCPYCHREGERTPGQELSLMELRGFLETAAGLGFAKVKFTGGEPLLREDIVEIVATAKEFGFEEVSITTNGTIYPELAQPLKEAGLCRVNIGCDSLSSSVSEKSIASVLPWIRAAHSAGLTPIKLNMVVLRGVNEDEIDSMMALAEQEQLILQLIELLDIDPQYYRKHFYSLAELEKQLATEAERIYRRPLQNRTQYFLGKKAIEIVRPTHKGFCANCKKLRLTSDGYLKPCLMRNDNLVRFTDADSILEAISRRRAYYGDD